MRQFVRCIFIVLLIFSSIGPFLNGKPVQAESANTQIKLDFIPNDTAIDPDKPIIYATKLGSRTLYAVNYSSGEIKTLTMPNPAERLDYNNGKLYVTQLKMSHDFNNNGPYSGAIAEVDPNTFTISNVLDINQDPYDIAVDQDGYVYISPGSGQSGNLKVYSMKDKKEIPQNTGLTKINDEKSNIFYDQVTSKVYAIDSNLSPRDVEAYEVVNGVVKNHYDSPYHGDYPLNVSASLSPDGLSMYNSSGVVFGLATYKSGDMNYRFSYGKEYNDFAFSQQLGLTFAAGKTSGIDVYKYDTKTFQYSLRKDLYVQKLYIQNGLLITIDKDDNGNYFIETMNANTQPSSGVPETPGIPDPAGTLTNLGFKPNDAVIDPVKPILYMTRPGSKTIYAANLTTGEIKALALPYPAERIELYNNKLYVTQQKMAHEYSTTKPLEGAIAEVDAASLTLTKVMDVDTDPYDIAIDNGYIFISPGSNQFADLKVYSLANGEDISNGTAAQMRAWSYLYHNEAKSKVYSITTDTSPRDVDAFEANNGVIKSHYNSPYHGDYPLEPFAEISPDGQEMYNNSGVVFDLETFQSGDMTYAFSLGRKYADYAFSVSDQLTFAARTDGGIDVYKYDTNKYLYTIKKDLNIQKLFYQNGQLAAIGTDSNGKDFIVAIDAKTQGLQDPPGNSGTPAPPGDPGTTATPIKLVDAASVTMDSAGNYYYDNFYNQVKNVSLDSILAFKFDEAITVKDKTKITLKGPNGVVGTEANVSNDTLAIVPDLLNGSTTYTLTINKGALSGSKGQSLEKDLVFQFTTASNWEQYGGKWYYYDPSTGDYLTGWQTISGNKYYFDEEGAMQTGWKKINNVWYYFNHSGVVQTGWLKLGQTWYYFDKNGAMQTGWLKLDKTWYYFKTNGAMQTGWVKLGKTWYYFYTNGVMASNTKVGKYKFAANGAWIQ